MTTVDVRLPVKPCRFKERPHRWHICKPGGSSTTVCPGVGYGAAMLNGDAIDLDGETRLAAPHGAVVPTFGNERFEAVARVKRSELLK